MSDPNAIAETMNRMWAKFLPDLEERVATLEIAAAAAAQGSLTPEICEQASSAAHKLAGVLGTFGLDEGTELAREAESFYERHSSHRALDTRPAALAARLRALVADRTC